MKLSILAICLIPVLTFFTLPSAAQAKASQDSGAAMLQQFYTNYITTVANSTDENKLDRLRNKYCTKKILNRIKQDEELDYDPFLKAQDADIDWLRTLVVKKDAKNVNVYMVSYLDNYTKKRIVNRLAMVKEGSGYKIDDILNY